jgi:hypothetical protein
VSGTYADNACCWKRPARSRPCLADPSALRTTGYNTGRARGDANTTDWYATTPASPSRYLLTRFTECDAMWEQAPPMSPGSQRSPKKRPHRPERSFVRSPAIATFAPLSVSPPPHPPSSELRERIDPARVPVHVAVIMDGNGRWAENKGEHRVQGHVNGVRPIRETLTGATEIGMKYLTLYAFSTENWNRPQAEVDALMELLVNTLASEVGELHENGVRLNAIGDLDSLPTGCRTR